MRKGEPSEMWEWEGATDTRGELVRRGCNRREGVTRKGSGVMACLRVEGSNCDVSELEVADENGELEK